MTDTASASANQVPAIEQPIDPTELISLIQQRNPLLVEACASQIIMGRLRKENESLRGAAQPAAG